MITKAKESPQVTRARKKLKKQFQEQSRLINAQALKEMDEGIRLWLERHSSERIKLQNKTITIFDENQHPEKIHSKFIHKLLGQLQQESAKKSTRKTLHGRVKSD